MRCPVSTGLDRWSRAEFTRPVYGRIWRPITGRSTAPLCQFDDEQYRPSVAVDREAKILLSTLEPTTQGSRSRLPPDQEGYDTIDVEFLFDIRTCFRTRAGDAFDSETRTRYQNGSIHIEVGKKSNICDFRLY